MTLSLVLVRAYAGDDGVGEADWAAPRVSVVRENVQPGGERSAAAAATTASAGTAATTNDDATTAHAFSRAGVEMLLYEFRHVVDLRNGEKRTLSHNIRNCGII